MYRIKELDELLEYRGEDLLEAAIETANWLEDSEIISDQGLKWKQDPESDRISDASQAFNDKSLYAGSAGIAFFLVRLYLITKDRKYIDKAVLAADYLINTYEKDAFEISKNLPGIGKGLPTGYYAGNTGIAYFVSVLYQALKENNDSLHIEDIEKYKNFVLKVADDIVDAQKNGTWTETVGILGDGGLLLLLAYLYEVTGEKKYLEAAEANGKYFIDNAEEINDGYRWYTTDSIAFGLGPNGYFPNFEYGAAGNAYLLAILYKLTDQPIYLDYAKGALRYVESVSVKKGKGILIPYNVPYKNNLFYLGNCHGPAGDARAYKLIYELTGEEHYKEYTFKLAEGILNMGAPRVRSDGYWNTDCICCGTAGMLEFFIGTDKFFNIDEYQEVAQEAGEILIGDSLSIDHKRTWYSAWTRTLPKDVDTYTGFYHGSSGCASALLTLYNESHDKIKLPSLLEDYWVTK